MSEGQRPDLRDADPPWEKPRKKIRWYHNVHEEDEVQDVLNKLTELGYDMEDPELVVDGEGAVPGADGRAYLLSGVRKECDCAPCRRANRRRERQARQADSSEVE